MSKIQPKYKFAVIAADIVIFTVKDEKLQVLLIKMKKPPFLGTWAAPGGLVRPLESVDKAAGRILKEKAGVRDVFLEQLYTFGRVDRDPFGRVVSVAYYALIPAAGLKLKTSAEYGGVEWWPADKMPDMAYDHREIINYAVRRLRTKLEYTNAVYGLLPEEFTLSDMQRIYEIILGRGLDKRNFRKKILGLKLLKATGKKTAGEANRPAALYRFLSRRPENIEIL